jgi:hypothetical protein
MTACPAATVAGNASGSQQHDGTADDPAAPGSLAACATDVCRGAPTSTPAATAE